MQAPAVTIRRAREEDVAAIVALLAADDIGGHGDTTDDTARADYLDAFRTLQQTPRETLYVAECDGEIVGTFQTLLTTTLSGRGGTSMIVEAVQTRADMRGRGIGGQMIGFCLEEARRLGLRQVQLTSNAARTDAHRFYERFGFAKSHFGFKYKLK
ncbi:MAG: GNAT family N-acetyltransferase [Alphaproteobacteria bacterium]|nr:GNAT family N-acetyltransferase [Rhizobiaceae bacterium]MBU3961499.1 GNAT family N-acetyltransferase [Alphaproteobacteria bacterium]MBU4050337.1 GNAT family N-acetyltransferase [Alphaproteobacteria bacterium]MBU4088771.1 GNAT family N-acetyltransferase [Alphaproteobacteria bacterium]MBU4158269.1 GNAT family N-acetyltransferase [Alphaproteobacteria bacterium]